MKSGIKTLFMTAVLLALLCPLLGGCMQNTRPLLWYQETLIHADVSTDGQTYRIAPAADGFTVTILAPIESAGVTFTVTDVSSVVSAYGMEIPVSEAMTAGAARLISLFTLEEARVSEVHPDKESQTVRARFKTADGDSVCAIFGADGLPVSFETETGVYTVIACKTGTDTETQ